MARRQARIVGFLLLLGWSAPARAERDLDQVQTDDWYALHLTVLGAGAAGTAAAQFVGEPLAARFHETLWFEGGTSRNFSLVTSRVSDFTLATAALTPVATLGFAQSGPRVENSLLIYGETLMLSLWVGTAVKHLVVRARPYGLNKSPGALAFAHDSGKDQLLSFYSGHSAMSFTSATAGAFLFSDGNADEGWQAAMWALELSLAGFTAHARVRAGMHYPSDVIIGSLVGTAFGLGVPLLHEVRPQVSAVEWAAIVTGLAGGVTLAWLLPTGAREAVLEYRPSVQPVVGGALLGIGKSW